MPNKVDNLHLQVFKDRVTLYRWHSRGYFDVIATQVKRYPEAKSSPLSQSYKLSFCTWKLLHTSIKRSQRTKLVHALSATVSLRRCTDRCTERPWLAWQKHRGFPFFSVSTNHIMIISSEFHSEVGLCMLITNDNSTEPWACAKRPDL